MKKRLIIALTLPLLLMSSGCSNNESTESAETIVLEPSAAKVDQSKVFGVCYELHVRRDDPDFDYKKDAILLKNLGVKSIRFWLQANDYMISPTKVYQDGCNYAHEVLNEFIKNGIEIIAMNNTNYSTGLGASCKPQRDLTPNSYYLKWLNDYSTTYYTLANEFKEIKYFEIENETNGSFCNDMNNKDTYSLQQKSELTTDMLYYASQGIHKANKDAITVIGGPVGLSGGKIKNFFESIYNNIESGEFGYKYDEQTKESASKNPDDYFQMACWHPYIEQTTFYKSVFKKYNDEIYQVILNHEGKHKEVMFSEIGWTNKYCSEEISAKYLKSMYELVTAEMPYVKFVTYYKLYDYGDAATYWTHEISRYGLIYDPMTSRQYNDGYDENTIVEAGSPKKQAYAFQEVAGGSGIINIKEITID